MSSVQSSSQHTNPNGIQYVDPRALEQIGGGCVGPYYLDPPQLTHEESTDLDFHLPDLDLDLLGLPGELLEDHTSSATSYLRHNNQGDVYLAPAAPITTTRSSLRGDAPIFVPSAPGRPQLTLITDQEALASQLDANLSTPRILVLPADVESSSKVESPRASQSRGRARRRSSPARRPSQSLVPKGTPAYRIVRGNDTGNRLLSPLRAEEWITEHSYHPGDRFPLVRNGNQIHIPVTYPSVPGTPSVTSSQRGGPYFCNVGDCRQRDKPWSTPSELRKHQLIHGPKDLRPHPCPQCPKRFQYPKDRTRHIQAKHDVGTPSTCEVCSRVLSRGDNLRRHLEGVHGIIQTPSAPAESPAASPASTMSMSNFSESMYSDAGSSTALTSPSSQTQAAGRKLHQRLLLPAIPSVVRPVAPFCTAPTSVPMSRWNTN